jgi:hypothetical protein
MIKLVIDMNLSPTWVHVFDQAGMEAIHWSKVGEANAPASDRPRSQRYGSDGWRVGGLGSETDAVTISSPLSQLQ